MQERCNSSTLAMELHLSCSNPSVLRLHYSYLRQWTGRSWFLVMTCRLYGDKPLPEPMMAYCSIRSFGKNSMTFWTKDKHRFMKIIDCGKSVRKPMLVYCHRNILWWKLHQNKDNSRKCLSIVKCLQTWDQASVCQSDWLIILLTPMLRHWCLDKMVEILQMAFSNAFSWIVIPLTEKGC